jgi:GTP 3',8-cyclase
VSLIDNYHRIIDYLRVSITDRCNLRCLYCMPAEGIPLISHHDILRYEEIFRLVRVGAREGIRKVRITGGEPLVRKGVVDCVAELATIPGIEDLSMTTNAVLLKQFARPLKQAGLQRINVSLDTLHPEAYSRITRTDKFPEVWEGIEEALAVGLSPVKINVVTMYGINHHEVVDFARLTLRLPLAVRFIEYMPAGRGEWDPSMVFSAAEILRVIEQELGALSPLEEGGSGPAVRYRVPGSRGEIGLINPVSNHFCASCNRLRITADGHLRTCLFSDAETDLKPFLRSGATDEQLAGVLREALGEKPKQHLFTTLQFSKCQRSMSAIGG